MEMDLAGWLVTGFAILITGISKSGLGGALGGLAVPFMSMWMSPRDAVAVMLPVLITMDMVGIRAWRGKADWQDLRTLIPGALVGIALGTLYQKRFCPAFDLRTGSVIQFVPTLLATSLVASQTEAMVVTWSGHFVFALLWLVLVLSVGAISLLNLLIRSGSAVNVASLFYLTPPTTALIAWAVFGETLTGLALVGMGVTVFGVWLARK